MWRQCGAIRILVISIVSISVVIGESSSSQHHHPNPHVDRRLGCAITQRGFHLKLSCSLTPKPGGGWEQCHIGIDLDKGVYINPYEVKDKLPGLSFNITRRASREASWFSRTFLGGGSDSASKTSYEHQVVNSDNEDGMVTKMEQINIPASSVNVEAPAWAADASYWKFILASSSPKETSGTQDALLLDIPLHLRYTGPTPGGGAADGVFGESRVSCNGEETPAGPLGLRVPTGCTSELLLVMPLTVFFLLIGIIALLLQ